MRDYLHSPRDTEELVRELAGDRDDVAELLNTELREGRRRLGEDRASVDYAVNQLRRYIVAAKRKKDAGEEQEGARNRLAALCEDRSGLTIFDRPMLTYTKQQGRIAGNPQIADMVAAFNGLVSELPDDAKDVMRELADKAAEIVREQNRSQPSRRLSVRTKDATALVENWMAGMLTKDEVKGIK